MQTVKFSPESLISSVSRATVPLFLKIQLLDYLLLLLLLQKKLIIRPLCPPISSTKRRSTVVRYSSFEYVLKCILSVSARDGVVDCVSQLLKNGRGFDGEATARRTVEHRNPKERGDDRDLPTHYCNPGKFSSKTVSA